MLKKTLIGAGLIATAVVSPLAASAQTSADLTALSASEAAQAIRSGKISSRALVEASLAQAKAHEDYHSMISVLNEQALAAADAVDKAVAAGETLGPLAGVPLVVKDNIIYAGAPTTAGTPALKDFMGKQTAPVLQKLLDAGAIMLGKANLHELAFGATSNNGYFGAVSNAVKKGYIAGGSSGGTATAIALGIAPAGLGTDTGGSVRVPSALNGLTGLRPTTGRYSTEGTVPISHTRDTGGPMAKTVADLVLLDSIVTGAPPELEPARIGKLRLGVAKPLTEDLSPETARVFQAMLKRLEGAGATLVQVDIGEMVELEEQSGFAIALHEAKTGLSAFLQEHDTGISLEDLAAKIGSPDVAGIFASGILGPDAPTEAAYRKAMKETRPALQAAYAKLFSEQKLDALVFPSTPIEAMPLAGNEDTVEINGRREPTFLTYIRNSGPGSVAGIPGLAVPMGETEEGLPVGLSLDAPEGQDRALLAIGLALEKLD